MLDVRGVVHQVLVPTLSDSRSSVFLGKLQTELTNRGVVIPEFKMTEAVVASGSTKNNRELQDDKKKADNEDTTYVKYPDVGVLCADRRSDLMGRAILDTMNQAVFEISNKKHTIVLPHGTCVLFDEHVPHGGWGGRDKDMVFEYKMKWTTQKTASFLNVSTPMVHELAKQHGWEICESSSNQDLWVVSALCARVIVHENPYCTLHSCTLVSLTPCTDNSMQVAFVWIPRPRTVVIPRRRHIVAT